MGYTFQQFLSTRFRTLGRERLDRAEMTPPELYQAKVSGYLRIHQMLRADGRRSAIVRFEDLVTNQRRALMSLVTIPSNPRAFVPIEQSTKDPKKTSSFYANYYGKNLWINEIPAEEWQKIRLDPELLEVLGYPIDIQGAVGVQERDPTSKNL